MTSPAIEELLPKPIVPAPKCPEGMRTFTVYRGNDETGVSGIGVIIQGVLFANGKCVIQWICEPDPGDTQIKDFERFLDTHIRSHPTNKTILTYDDGEQLKFDPVPTPDEPDEVVEALAED
jgi:hypothetical protein